MRWSSRAAHGVRRAPRAAARQRDDPADYLPTQKLVDVIARTRVDGIRYSSPMAPAGTNVVLFERWSRSAALSAPEPT